MSVSLYTCIVIHDVIVLPGVMVTTFCPSINYFIIMHTHCTPQPKSFEVETFHRSENSHENFLPRNFKFVTDTGRGWIEARPQQCYPQKFVFEQNLAKLQNIYTSKILGYTVVCILSCTTIIVCRSSYKPSVQSFSTEFQKF